MMKKTDAKSIYDLYETDAARESQGVVLNFGVYGKFTVARAGGSNLRYQRALATKSEPYRHLIAAKAKKPDEKLLQLVRDLSMEAFAETVVLGWEGVTGRDGKAIPFSQAACLKLFRDLPALFDEIQEQASSLANFQDKAIEEDLGN